MQAKHWLVAGVFALIVFSFIGSLNDSTVDTSHSTAPKIDVKAKIHSALELEYTWTLDELVSVMTADFTITNASDWDVKDIEIECQHFSKSGTNIDQNIRTIYEVFRSGESRYFPDFNMGFAHSQANKTACTISDFKVID